VYYPNRGLAESARIDTLLEYDEAMAFHTGGFGRAGLVRDAFRRHAGG
jgi:hypothetical protein